MNKREQRIAESRIKRAREALAKLTLAEQRALFTDFKLCTCTEIARLAGKSPATAAGMLVGGILGAVLGVVAEDDKEKY